jgi:Winged helix DNA-binding domain
MRQLNRALLARQLLLARTDRPIPAALEQVGGIQAQYAPAMYVALWSRLAGFERDALTRALEQRTVVQGTLMRCTIHLVSAADYWPLAIAVREARRDWWRRVTRGAIPDAKMQRAADRCRERLAAGPAHRREIDEAAGKELTNGVGMWLDMVRVPPSGTWECW